MAQPPARIDPFDPGQDDPARWIGSPLSRDAPRICHLGKFYPPFRGGIERHVQILARAQAALGARVRVVAVNHRGSVVEQRSANSLAIESDGGARVLRVGRLAALSGFDVCPGLTRLIARELRRGVDVLHLHTPNPTMMLAVALLARANAALIITHHNDIVRQRLTRLMLRPAEAWVYARAARIIATTPNYADASTILQQHRDRVEIVPLGTDLAPFLAPSPGARAHADRLRRDLGDAPLWLAVGRLRYYKGLHIAIRALAETPGRLLVIGVGPLEQRLRALAVELGVADRVIWWGEATDDEVAGSYRAASALWFPSCERAEGFGLVQVEAMASACPVINSDVPGCGVAWVSRHEQTGLTVPVADAPAFAHAARRLLEEPGLRDRLAAAARDRAVLEFDQAVMARATLAVYHRALGWPTATDPDSGLRISDPGEENGEGPRPTAESE
jgi:glycosyltransferase involved in cell wall biosynthesis